MIDVKQTTELASTELIDIMAARIAVFVVEQNCPYQEVDENDLSALHVRVMENNEMKAYARILLSQDGVHFGRVLVPKAYRGKGYAKQLVQALLEEINTRFPNQPILIQAQSYLIDFYQSFGFKKMTETYLEDNIPHVDMRLEWS